MFSLALFRLDYAERKKAINSLEATQANRVGENILHTYLQLMRAPWVRVVLLTVFIEGMLFYGTFAYAGAWLKEVFNLSYFVVGVI
ncbi:MAG: hypothetical protein GTO41_24305, partial [Burkholderiales bacterium]|nr:hypothetical protein [Burkholderiales bacterium]